jgi:hypothetical protein
MLRLIGCRWGLCSGFQQPGRFGAAGLVSIDGGVMFKYKPMSHDSFIWRYACVVYTLALRLGKKMVTNPITDYGGLTERQYIEKCVDERFGYPINNPEDRYEAFGLLFAPPCAVWVPSLVMVFACAIIGGFTRIDAFAVVCLWALAAGVTYPVVLTIGFLLRAQVAEIDMKRHKKAGRPEGFVPSGLSQPKSRDFLYPIPFALYMIAMAIFNTVQGRLVVL